MIDEEQLWIKLIHRCSASVDQSTIIQISAQHQSNSEEEKQRLSVSLGDISDYESVINDKLVELPKDKCGNWIIRTEKLKDRVNTTLCRSYTIETLDTVETGTVLDFETYFFENEDHMKMKDIFVSYKRKSARNKKRKLDFFLSKVKILISDKVIGKLSNLEVHCFSDEYRAPMHCLLERRTKYKKG